MVVEGRVSIVILGTISLWVCDASREIGSGGRLRDFSLSVFATHALYFPGRDSYFSGICPIRLKMVKVWMG